MDLTRYSAAETLRDGRAIEIRALRPADRDDLLGAVGRMSDASVHSRFFSAKRRFSAQEVAYYVQVDFINHVALVASLGENTDQSIVAGARYVVSEPGTAEVAFAVDDQYQGQGIGTLLMKHLVGIARQSGLHELFAEVLQSNTAMLKVFEKGGLAMSTKREHGIVHVKFKIS